MKIKVLIILAAAFALFYATPVKASDIDIVNTGDHFRFSNRISRTSNVRVTNTNIAHVTQRVFAIANTGLNVAERNIGEVEIETGNASVNTNLWFMGNINRTVIEMER